MMNMGIQNNQALMQKLMQMRQGGQGGMPSNPMPQGGGNPNVSPMPQMGGMPTQNPNNPMGGGMQSMAPQDPMMARKLMMMKMAGGGGGNMGNPSRTVDMSNGGGMMLNRMG